MRKLIIVIYMLITVVSFGQTRPSILDIRPVPNVSALSSLMPGNNTWAYVQGYYHPGDSGGGNFRWDATSTEPDNGGTVIAVAGVSVGRWKREISQSFLSVAAFGAIPDDGVCDSNAITAALESQEADTTRPIRFATGEYDIMTPVVYEAASSGVYIHYASRTVDIVGERGVVIKNTSGGFAFTLTRCHWGRISGLTFIGDGIHLSSQGFTISDCVFNGPHGLQVESSGVVSVERCLFECEVAIEFGVSSGDSTVTRCDIYPSDKGLYFSGATGDINVNNNIISCRGAGIGLYASSTAHLSQLRVTNNQIYSSASGTCVLLKTGETLATTFLGNTFWGDMTNTNDVVSFKGLRDSNISNNSFLQIGGVALSLINSPRNIISNNNFDNVGSASIVLTGAIESAIHNNIYRNWGRIASAPAILLDGTVNITVSNNNFYNNEDILAVPLAETGAANYSKLYLNKYTAVFPTLIGVDSSDSLQINRFNSAGAPLYVKDTDGVIRRVVALNNLGDLTATTTLTNP
jgi:hypothetical protein